MSGASYPQGLDCQCEKLIEAINFQTIRIEELRHKILLIEAREKDREEHRKELAQKLSNDLPF